ncbi:Vacuolar protein-sorting-associated protein 27 [Malassezia equina]|uniref:Vacuolar protein-sorting-associated protein 27 n=1 Tax=Malassezia equina TaxID=1381935 RepID=A0AAF0ED29_9BASI|nr:Vacuolar protein-sorting-associated protein 27 [Malassezia equina]
MGFRELVEKATSPLIPSGHEDMALNLEVCNCIRSKAVTPRKAMQELKTRIEHTNPNVQILALSVRIGIFISQLSDTCIKNSGTSFLGQIASLEFMDSMTSILRERPNLAPVVKAKMLQCLQDWKHLADARPNELGYIKDVVRMLEQQGYEFPSPDPIAVAAASCDTEEDPDLAAAIAASLKEWDEQQKREAASMSHEPTVTTMEPLTTAKSKSRPHQRAPEVDTMDLDNILTFSQTVTQPNAAWKHTVSAKGLPLPIQNMQDKASASRGRLLWLSV